MDRKVVKVKLAAGGACKSMNHAQKYLAQANRHIAELVVQIAAQHAIVKQTLDTGQRSEMAESLLDALEGSLRLFEKHRMFLLSCSNRSPMALGINGVRNESAP
jgi:hypothetical protein